MSEIVIYSSEGELVCKPYSINDLKESKPITQSGLSGFVDAEQSDLEVACEQSK